MFLHFSSQVGEKRVFTMLNTQKETTLKIVSLGVFTPALFTSD